MSVPANKAGGAIAWGIPQVEKVLLQPVRREALSKFKLPAAFQAAITFSYTWGDAPGYCSTSLTG